MLVHYSELNPEKNEDRSHTIKRSIMSNFVLDKSFNTKTETEEWIQKTLGIHIITDKGGQIH